MLNLKTNLRNFLSENAELLRNNYNFTYNDTRSAEHLKILLNFCESKVNCIGFAGRGQNASMDFGSFLVHSYCDLFSNNKEKRNNKNKHDMCIVMCLASFQSNSRAISIATCRTQFYGKKLRMFSRWICEYPLLFNPLLLSYESYMYVSYFLGLLREVAGQGGVRQRRLREDLWANAASRRKPNAVNW